MNLKISKPAYEFVKKMNCKSSHEDKYLYFLSLLTYNTNFKPLKSNILRSTLGKSNKGLNYKGVINLLEESKIVECDGNYIVGKKSKAYRLNKMYFDEEPRDFALSSIALINKLEIAELKQYELLPDHLKKMKYNLCELTLNGLNIHVRRPIKGRTGRVFHFLTAMKKERRKSLMWQNSEKLCEFDFNGSQPYFLSLIVCKGLGILSYDEQMPDDLRLYLNFCKEGRIYEAIAQFLGIDISNKAVREKFKRRVYNQYFFNRKYDVVKNSEIGRIFETHFPTIHNYIINNFINKEKTLAFHLQNIESHFVVNTIYKRLYELEIWSATIHDSIVCKESDKDVVREIIKNAMSENIIPAFLNESRWENSADGREHPKLSSRRKNNNDKIVRRWDKNSTEDMILSKEVFVKSNNRVISMYDILSSNGVGIPLKQNKNGDTIEKGGGMSAANYLAHLASMVYLSNKKDELMKQKQTELIKGIGQLAIENKPVTRYQLHKLTGINKGTIRKHWDELQHYAHVFEISKDSSLSFIREFILDSRTELSDGYKLELSKYIFENVSRLAA